MQEENAVEIGEPGGLSCDGSPPLSVPVGIFRTIHPVIAPLITQHPMGCSYRWP